MHLKQDANHRLYCAGYVWTKLCIEEPSLRRFSLTRDCLQNGLYAVSVLYIRPDNLFVRCFVKERMARSSKDCSGSPCTGFFENRLPDTTQNRELVTVLSTRENVLQDWWRKMAKGLGPAVKVSTKASRWNECTTYMAFFLCLNWSASLLSASHSWTEVL